MITTRVQTVNEGIDLCNDNAQRLLRNALLLLNNGGSDGLAYALWSLAVEEFGKAILLRGQVKGRSQDDTVSIRDSYPHHEKFTAGFSELKDLLNTSIGRLFRVTCNIGAQGTNFADPLQPNALVAVPPLTTGLFEDVSHAPGVDPTVALRMELIYVDWNKVTKCWTRPGETFRRSGVVGRWELNHTDLRRAIDSLKRRLRITAGRRL